MAELKNISIPGILKPYIRNVWFVGPDELRQRNGSLSVYADGCPGIFFHQATNGMVMNDDQQLTPLFLYGQTVAPAVLKSDNPGNMIVLNFHPHVMPTLFGFHANEITDECVDLQLLPAVPRISLTEQLFDTLSADKQLQVIFNYLQGLAMKSKNGTDAALNFAVSRIQEKGTQLSLKDLHRELNITERTFERRFEQFVGVSPKLFSRIVQFQRSLRQLTHKKFSRLSDIAYDNGYADQSHFIRQFKQFTGQTPLEFAKETKWGNFPVQMEDASL